MSWLVSICAQGGLKNPSEAAVMWEDVSGRHVGGCGAQGKPKEGVCLVAAYEACELLVKPPCVSVMRSLSFQQSEVLFRVSGPRYFQFVCLPGCIPGALHKRVLLANVHLLKCPLPPLYRKLLVGNLEHCSSN
jgi:hypothetical protein